MQPQPTSPPPGWYPDPAGSDALRYYDGETWTQRTRPSTPKPGWYPDPANPLLLRYFESTWTHKVAPAPRRPLSSLPTPQTPPVSPTLPPANTPQTPSKPARTSRSLPGVSLMPAKHARASANVIFLVGLLSCLYVVWTLVGTNLLAAVDQRSLNEKIATSAAPTHAPAAPAVPATTAPSSAAPATAPTPTRPPLPTLPAEGQPVGHIVIPKLSLDYVFVAGTAPADLSEGPGVWLEGVVPGTPGNATISGHRTTHGGFFRHLDSLQPGDQIIIRIDGQPDAVYEVRAQFVVKPSEVAVTDQTPGVRLTLTTCDPVGSDAARRVIQAEEVSGAWADHALPAAQWQPSH